MMKRFARWAVLGVGLSLILVAVMALANAIEPITRQTEQVPPPATLFVPPP